jgi:anaerobic selenocysteine-containing dehydrogenase
MSELGITIKMKQAVIQGNAKLIIADPRKIDRVGFADIWLRQKPGTDVALINGLMNVIIEERLVAEGYVNERTEDIEGLKETVKSYTSVDNCSSLILFKNVFHARINYNIVSNMHIILNQNAFIAPLEHML